MAEPINWSQYAEQPDATTDWSQYAEPMQQQQEEMKQPVKYDNFLDAEVPMPEWLSGLIHGGNKGFSKVFGFGQHVKDMQQNYEYSKQHNPLATEIGNVGAQIASSIPFYMAGGQAAGMLPIGATGQAITGAALGGGAYGGFKNPEEGETKGGNALHDALISAAFPAVPAALRGGKKLAAGAAEAVLPARYSQEKTVKEASKIYHDLADYFKKGYEEVLTNPALPATTGLSVNPKAVSQLRKAAPKLKDSLSKAINTESPHDVHDAASKLGKYINKEYKKLQPNDETIRLAESIKAKLEGSLDKTLSKVPELKDAYRALDKEYESSIGRMHPKIRDAFRRFEKNKLGSEDVLRKIKSPTMGEEFRHRFGEELPGIETAKNPEAWKNLPFTKQGINLFKKYFGD